MLIRRSPPSLLTLSLRCLIDLVQSYHSKCEVDSQLDVLRSYLTIPPNIFDQWVDQLLSTLNKSQLKSNVHYIILGNALTKLNFDDFPSLPVNVVTLCHLFPKCVNLKCLSSRYAPFFWKSTEIYLFQQSVLHLKNLQSLTLCNLNLMGNPTFLETVGVHCPKIKELDLSHGQILSNQCEVISRNFPNLEVLRMKQRSEKYRTITLKDALLLIKSLLKLRLFDDDSSAWSCILPALKQLGCDKYFGKIALMEYLTVYQSIDVESKFVASVERICLDGKALKHSDHDVSEWLCHSFPGLRSVDLRLENVWFPVIENFVMKESIGWKIHSLYLARSPFNLVQFQTIGRHVPNLRKFEIVNSSPLDVSQDQHRHHEHHHQQILAPDVVCFRQLEFLSYTGAWNEDIASLLLDHSTHLRELHLKAHSLPVQFLSHNPLVHLQCLVLDLSYIMWNMSVFFVYDLELNFVRRIIQTAVGLREIRLKSRPFEEWESLRQHLKIANFDLQILRPI